MVDLMKAFAPYMRKRDEIPAKFVDFCGRIGVTLTPGQLAFAKVAFDGADPADLAGGEAEFAAKMFGSIGRINRRARRAVAAVIGRRAGKSYLCALRLLHLALTVSLHTLAPGEHATGLIVAPRLKDARHTIQYVAGVLRTCLPGSMAEEPTVDRCMVKRADGLIVAIECLAASQGGAAVRGRSLVGAVLEECAFFRSEQFVVNDVEIYRAVTPAILRGGQVLLPSSPWAEEGLLYDMYSRNSAESLDAIAAKCPTLVWRDTEDTREYVEAQRIEDPENARREFDAEFMSVAATQFFATRAIEAATEAWEEPEQHINTVTAAGGDFAFSRNSSALVITVRDAEKYTIALVEENKPTGMPLRPSDVVSGFAEHMKRWCTDELMADAHYRESVAEHLDEHGLSLVPAPEGASGKSETYVLARQLLHQGKLRLPKNKKLLKQLREVRVKPTSGGQLSIKSPEWTTGEHGDIVSALVLSVFAASQMLVPDEVVDVPKVGTAAFYEQRERDRRARQQAQYETENDPENSDWILGPS